MAKVTNFIDSKSPFLPSVAASLQREKLTDEMQRFRERVDVLKHYGDLAPLFTPADLAAFCGLSVLTITKWRKTGRGPDYMNIGYRGKVPQYRYDYRDIVRWLDERKIKPGARRNSKPGDVELNIEGDFSHLVFRE